MLIIALIGWRLIGLGHHFAIGNLFQSLQIPDERLFRSDVFSSQKNRHPTSTEHLEGSNYRDVIAVAEPENVQTESSANEDLMKP